MAQGLLDVFNGQNQELVRVTIVPHGTYTGVQTINLPAGYQWTDFESIEFYHTTFSTGVPQRVGGDTFILDKDQIAVRPTDWTAIHSIQSGIQTQITATSSTQPTTGVSGDIQLKHVIGYIKRYKGYNASTIVNVNNGNNVSNNQRYEIDIATELGTDYVGKDLIVQVEIYNNSGSGIAGWGSIAGVWYDSGTGTGVHASVFNDKIVVQTGLTRLTQTASHTGNPFNNSSNITSAPCRVKVWKVEQFITNTAGSVGGGGKTVLWSGSVTSGTITFADSMTNYDAFIITGFINGGYYSATFVTDLWTGTNKFFSENTNSVGGGITRISSTQATVHSFGGYTTVLVTGINYSS